MSSTISIAHISDLHFPHWGDRTYDNLKKYLKDKKPHLILVTGDLTEHPWPRLHRKVRDRLVELVDACNAGEPPRNTMLAVVPGNHDYAVYGNITFLTSPISFRSYFKPYHQEFFEMSSDDGQFKALFFCFNSNPLIAKFAKGAVSRRQLNKFRQRVAGLRGKDPDGFDAAYKIAVLHHHPLPIPHSEALEEFNILTNAGTVLRVLAQCKINLILHGHKHDLVISSVNMGTAYAANQGAAFSATRRMFVVASGSTLKEGETENTCNLIILRKALPAEVTPVGAYPDEDFREKETTLLPSLDDFINEQFIAERRRLGYEVAVFDKRISINSEGDSFTHCRLENLKVLDVQNFRKYKATEIDPFTLVTLTGRIPAIQPIKSSDHDQPQLDDQQQDKTRRKVTGKLNLPDEIEANQTLGPLEYKYRILNGWALNAEEFRRKYSDKSNDTASEEEWIITPRLTQLLKLTIQLPDKCVPVRQPTLSVYAPVGNGFAPDPEAGLCKYYRSALNYDARSNTITLTLKKPLLKYKYVVHWLLPKSDQNVHATKYKSEAQELSKRLLSPAPNIKAEVLELMKDIEFLICDENEGLNIPDTQDIDVSLAIALDEPNKIPLLKVVADNLDNSQAENLSIEIGDGYAGRAFKLNEANFYQDSGDGRRDLKEMYVPFGRVHDHKVLYCIPLRHPADETIVVGVLTVGSGQGYSNLVPTPSNDDKQIMNKIIDIVDPFVVLSLSDLCGKILSVPQQKQQ
jgi:predicted MPP superfamily phosphohydrolase